MQRLPGKDILQARWSRFTVAEKLDIHTQLRGFVEELRAIPPPQSQLLYALFWEAQLGTTGFAQMDLTVLTQTKQR